MVSVPGLQLSTLKAPEPATLFFSHSLAQGSPPALRSASSLSKTKGMVTPRLGISSLSRRTKSMRKVLSSSATNCSGFSMLPAFICVVAKPPMLTARSSDHFTSFAVTGRPEWNLASRSLKVTLVPSLASCQLSASSGSSSFRVKVLPLPSPGSGTVL